MKTNFLVRIISCALVVILLAAAIPAYAIGDNSTRVSADDELIFTAREIYDVTEQGVWGDYFGCLGYDKVNLCYKNQVEYVRLTSYGGDDVSEAYFHLFSSSHKVAPYIAIKYRTTTTNINMQIFSDSVNKTVNGKNYTTFSVNSNGKWQLKIVDLTASIAEFDGQTANYLRFDFLNSSKMPENAYVDIAYIGFFNSSEEATAYDAESFTEENYIDPASPYTASDKIFYSCLDMINGMGPDGASNYNNRGGNYKKGVEVIEYNGTTFQENLLVISGWSVVDGGINKYIWSADYGKTWHDTGLYNRKTIYNDNDSGTYVNATESKLGMKLTDPVGAKKCTGYQCAVGSGTKCDGISIDLSDYKGKTVDITFAAVTEADLSKICVLDYIEGVYVGDKSEFDFTKIGYSDDNTSTIERADSLTNGVDAYYTGNDRSKYTVENMNTLINYDLITGGVSTVSSITNRTGGEYVSDTMKVFVRTTSGKVYYASNYISAPRPNIYRLGYYYYDSHIMDTDFINSASVTSELNLSLSKFTKYSSQHSTKPSVSSGVLSITITNPLDPYVCAPGLSYSASSYNAIQITIKSESASSMDILFCEEDSAFSSQKGKLRNVIKNDGEWHTYTFSTDGLEELGYSGTITGLRFDFDGTGVGTDVQIKDIKLQKITYDKLDLHLDRTMHTYSDKLHQEIHVVATEDTNGIDAVGIVTEISSDTVSKLIVKDKNGTHTSIDGVDWSSAEYIGFDIKNVGVFGYILPYDGKSGGMTVTLSNGIYTITQEATPREGTIAAPVRDTTNDFRMGHRIYTDSNHTFDAFLTEAEIERNPLTDANIKIDTNETPGAKFRGYDALKGAYYFMLSGAANFSVPYYEMPNKHYSVAFGIVGDQYDRNVYIYTHASSGALESAALLDVNDMMLPVPMEVCKNFSEGEEPIYNYGDDSYGDTIFPTVVKKDGNNYFKVLNLYQNWGQYPLKQISSIGYYVPYYHLSTGVTETNCISHYFSRAKNYSLLPDHRAMSQPEWSTQPQHYNAGHHSFLTYEDSLGNVIGTEFTDVSIGSYGPTYADVDLEYLSNDGKIKVELNHMEMPQTDENRGYYEIVYTVLDNVTINNFKEDFSIYSFYGYSYYKYLGYLDDTNNCKVVEMTQPDGTTKSPKYYTLGTNCPYFDIYYMEKATSYGNLGFIIDTSEIIIGGQKSNAKFAIKEDYQSVSLTLDIEGSVTLKAGDSIKINAIIMPWGGGWKDSNVVEFDASDYSVDVVTQNDGTKVYHVNNDQNVRRVRKEVLFNSYTATAGANTTVESTAFLPTVISNDGKTAQFTISGGFDAAAAEVNVTMLAKGFDSLGVPKVEELVNGAWVDYELSSKNTPDNSGNSHEYDGYAVTYDNGKYNYSFVTTITEKNSRTFRISVKSEATRGLDFELSEDGNSVVFSGIGSASSTDIVIPESYAGLPVVGIAGNALKGTDIDSITLHNGIVLARNNALTGELTDIDVYFADDNPRYRSEGNKIYDKQSGTLIWGGSIYGDVDGNGAVNLFDIVVMRKYLANYDFENDISLITVYSGADSNGDGQTDAIDLYYLRLYFAYYDYENNKPGVELGTNNLAE